MTPDREVLSSIDSAEALIFESGAGVSPLVARMFGKQGWRTKLKYLALRYSVWERPLTLINITGNTESPTFSAEPFAAQQLYKKALGRSISSLPQVR